MIFYGTRAKNIHNGQIKNVKCPSCENETNMKYSVFGKYAHVYWVPFFHMETIYVTECNNCYKTYEPKELGDDVKKKLKIEKERNGIKAPIWFYSGPFIILGLILFGLYSSMKEDSNTEEYYKNPIKGDVYEVKTMDGNYSSMKFERKLNDSIYFLVNDMAINKSSEIDKINIDKYYNDMYSFHKLYIDSLFKSHYIYKINR